MTPNPLVFFPYHTDEHWDDVPPYPWGRKLHLNQLKGLRPEHQDDRLGETRMFLADLNIPPGVDYVGQYNARAKKKYGWMGWDWGRLGEKLLPRLHPGRVVALWVSDLCPGRTDDWVAWSEANHPGMLKLLREMSEVSGRPLVASRTLWANDFVCHREVWQGFVDFFRPVFNHFWDKYGLDVPLSYYNTTGDRRPAYLYERIAAHYFSTRFDLDIQVL